MVLVKAHIDLAKAEASSIGGQLGRAAALAGIALAVVLLAIILLVVGGALFVGEWLFGSIGWGVLHGFLLLTGIAVAAVLVALGHPVARLVRAFVVAAAAAVVLAVVFGLDLPNRLYTAIGDGLGLAIDPSYRPLVVGLVVGALVGLLLGLLTFLRLRVGGARLGATFGMIVLGLLVGAFSAITFGPRVAIALGFAVAYLGWIVLMAIEGVRTGIDMDALKARFYPSQTIDTSKETLEWLKQRMPPGIGS